MAAGYFITGCTSFAALQVVVVDEIGSSDEVRAVRSIAQRGVMLVGTAHGVSLRSLISNPELNTLVGGVHQVVVGDKLARPALTASVFVYIVA